MLPQWISDAFGSEGLDFPLRAGEIDIRKLAVAFGRARVDTLGDADFVLLALCSKDFRERRPDCVESGPVSIRFLRMLLQCARDIRSRMLEETKGT
jgi:hypothetical protein